jgi:exodeoxyribonuclease V beta subunit
MAAFPSGTGFGHLVHSIYEQADFQVRDADELAPVVRDALGQYGAEAEWCQPLSAAVFASLRTALTPAGGGLPSLASVGSRQRLCELEFSLPVGSGGSAALSCGALASVLGEHPSDPSMRSYAERLRRLDFSPLRGGLRGFIDLVAEHDGRYYVLDYKSNRLGDSAGDYRPERLVPVMHRHHYVLQYLLYSVAVHRYLGLRLPDYSYERHFGGVYYLFVRGMDPSHPPGTGVYFDRPSAALVDALSSRLAR